MLELFNSEEREAEGWMNLFSIADERFQFVGITLPPGSKLSFVEARWHARGTEISAEVHVEEDLSAKGASKGVMEPERKAI